MDDEAQTLVESKTESSQHDLFDAIERGRFPRWNLQIQVMPEKRNVKVPIFL